MKLYEIYKDLLNEIDWEGEFSDVNHTCTPVDVVVKAMNEELARLKKNKEVKPKDRESRGKMDVCHPINKKDSSKKNSPPESRPL